MKGRKRQVSASNKKLAGGDLKRNNSKQFFQHRRKEGNMKKKGQNTRMSPFLLPGTTSGV